MPAPFSLTLLSLESDRLGPWRALLLVAGLLLASWILWFGFVRVPVRALSDRAHLEVAERPFPIQAPAHSGEIERISLELGRRVKKGEVLLELRPHTERHRLDAERERVSSLEQEIAAVERRVSEQEEALVQAERVWRIQIQEASASADEAKARSYVSSREAIRLRALEAQGLASRTALESAVGQSNADSAAAASRQHALSRLREDGARLFADRRAENERLNGLLAHQRGELGIARTAVNAYTEELEHLSVIAPADGWIAETRNRKAGEYVNAGDFVGTLLPDGPLHIVAVFSAAQTLGRIRTGQRGRLFLDAYPWTEFGFVEARVGEVGRSARDGSIEVELSIEGESSRMPLVHGLTGRLEVEIDRATPLQLVLQATSRTLQGGPPLSGQPAGASRGTSQNRSVEQTREPQISSEFRLEYSNDFHEFFANDPPLANPAPIARDSDGPDSDSER